MLKTSNDKYTSFICGLLLLTLCLISAAQAAVLPADRADIMYHRYVGDGVTIDGPAILLRKQVGNHVSFSANYLLDTVSGASIDVRVTASPYQEERQETGVGIDFLHDKTILSAGYTNSSENDYEANSFFVSASQDFFGDLSTVKFSYTKGSDEIFRTGDESFAEEADRQKFAFNWTQILSKRLIMGFSAEHISDEGFLNNPYRFYRFLSPDSERGFETRTEIYPTTRSSNAYSLNANYYLPYRAALYADARLYSDTWGVEAQNFKLGYIHPIDNWIIDVFARHYSQDAADFYRDIFSRENEFNFLARDKELSTYDGLTVGVHLSYEWRFSEKATFKKSSLHFEYDYMRFDYDDFRDATVVDVLPGEEPLFGFSANVFKIYASVFY